MQAWVTEEAADKVRELLQPVQRRERLVFQIRKTVDPAATDAIVF
jgi:hypothetical protein